MHMLMGRMEEKMYGRVDGGVKRGIHDTFWMQKLGDKRTQQWMDEIDK